MSRALEEPSDSELVNTFKINIEMNNEKALTRGGLRVSGTPGEVSRGHSSCGNEPSSERRRTHRASEGLNIKMFQMQQGGLSSPAISGTGQTK